MVVTSAPLFIERNMVSPLLKNISSIAEPSVSQLPSFIVSVVPKTMVALNLEVGEPAKSVPSEKWCMSIWLLLMMPSKLCLYMILTNSPSYGATNPTSSASSVVCSKLFVPIGT